jgi:hypothetical protein
MSNSAITQKYFGYLRATVHLNIDHTMSFLRGLLCPRHKKNHKVPKKTLPKVIFSVLKHKTPNKTITTQPVVIYLKSSSHLIHENQ